METWEVGCTCGYSEEEGLVVDGERKQREREKKCSAGCRPPLIDEVGYVVAETRAMGLKKRKADDKPGGTRVGVAVLIARDGRG